MTMPLVGFDHVALNCHDVAVSVAFYQRAFGFTVMHTWPSGTTMVGSGNIRLGLFSRPKATPLPTVAGQTLPDGRPTPDINGQQIIQHFAFLVAGDQFANAQKLLKSAGIPFNAPEDTGIGIADAIFVYDPDGNMVELTTYHPAPTPSDSRGQG